MAEIHDLNPTDASNTARFPENQAPSSLNDGARALEGLIARYFHDSDTSVVATLSGSVIQATVNRNSLTLTGTTSNYYANFMQAFTMGANPITGPASVNFDGIGAISLRDNVGASLSSSILVAGARALVVKDGTNNYFRLLYPISATLPSASATVSGSVELATQAEVNTGTDSARSITPQTLDGFINGKTDVTVTAADHFAYSDATDSNKTKKDTIQGILDLAGGGSTAFIATADISDAATVAFTGFDASAYDAYMLLLSNVIPVTDTQFLLLRTSTDGGSNYDDGSTDYMWALSRSTGDAAASGDGTTGDDDIRLNGDAGGTNETIGSAAGEDGISGCIYIHGPHLAKQSNFTWSLSFRNANAQVVIVNGGGFRDSAADVDACQLRFESGNLESGTVSFFGIKNS